MNSAQLGINLRLSQKQILAPQVLQSLSILHMNIQELSDYLQEQTLENPLIELEQNTQEAADYEQLIKQLEWLSDNAQSSQNVSYSNHDINDHTLQAVSYEDESLQAVLLLQLSAIKINSLIKKAAHYIIQSLNERGYLESSLNELSQWSVLTPEIFNKALTVVQNMEPWGVGARNLQECLLIQVKHKEIHQPEIEQVIKHYLHELSRNKLNFIADQLDISIDKVKSILATIRTLDPYPGLNYVGRETVQYITVDLIVIQAGDGLKVLNNDSLYPALRINSTYKNLLVTGDEQVRLYIENKLNQALLLSKHLTQRHQTLQSVGQAIVDYQKDFFLHGPGYLVPMTLAALASQLKIHESTVSRAVNGKYLQCAWGTYELKYFFSNAVGSKTLADAAPENIKLRIKAIIKNENSRKPLSDQKLCSLLNDLGMTISRRTIAKYRKELNIPNAAERKLF